MFGTNPLSIFQQVGDTLETNFISSSYFLVGTCLAIVSVIVIFLRKIKWYFLIKRGELRLNIYIRIWKTIVFNTIKPWYKYRKY